MLRVRSAASVIGGSHYAKRIARMSIDIGGMRKPYKSPEEAFLESSLVAKEPLGQFRCWFEQACRTEGILEPNAVCLATATSDGRPSCRMVLLKSYGPDGFVFYTNFLSRKAEELNSNPHASLCFYWEPLKRSVRVEGGVTRVADDEAEAYFQSRPRASQLGAHTSRQGEVIASREVLTTRQKDLQKTYGDESVPLPRPEYWGGYRVVPHTVEFWQGQSDRVHDRIVFTRGDEPRTDPEPRTELTPGEDGWSYCRLSP